MQNTENGRKARPWSCAVRKLVYPTLFCAQSLFRQIKLEPVERSVILAAPNVIAALARTICRPGISPDLAIRQHSINNGYHEPRRQRSMHSIFIISGRSGLRH